MKGFSFALRRVALVAAVLAAPLQAQRSTGDSFTWQAAMTSGATLVIRNINGPVTVQRASGGQVEVIAQKHYTRGDPSRVVIEAVRYGARNENAVVCAMWDPAARCNEGGQSGSGRSGDNGNVSVSFTVRLPAGVNAQLQTINGSVEVSGATGSVDANTINGNVSVAATGQITATTVSGDVDVSITAASGSEDIQLKSVNGSVSLRAPAGLNANLSASTINGSITSDFPVSVQGMFGMRNVDATLGSGGRKLSMTTINGSVVLRRS